MVFAAIVGSILVGVSSWGYVYPGVSPRCYDCFNFIAPTVSGGENITAPQVGLIVNDSYYGGFRGINASGAWVRMSNDKLVRSVNAPATVGSTDDVLKADATSGAFTINLPTAASVPGKVVSIKKIDSSANQITVDPYSAETIDGSSTKKIFFQNDVLQIVSDGANWQDITQKVLRAPTMSIATTTSYTGSMSAVGSGTYTTPPGVVYLRVRMVGGGGGGGRSSSATNGANGSAGGASTFGTSYLSAGGGAGGSGGSTGGGQPAGGAGGTFSLGSVTTGTGMIGGTGSFGWNMIVSQYAPGGQGGNSAFGGGGGAAFLGTGTAGAANTGGGGQGGGINSGGAQQSAAGGGAGGFVDVILTNPTTSYAYSVGAGGAGGTTGTNGSNGGAGGTGYIEVTEYYQ